MSHCYGNLKWIMDKLKSISVAYKSLDLQTQVFQQNVPYQIALLQGDFPSLSGIYIHGEKYLPRCIFPSILCYSIGISNL